MKAKRLRDILERALDKLSALNDDDEVRVCSNTYFLKDARIFLGISGYDGGYVNLSNIDVEGREDDDYE